MNHVLAIFVLLSFVAAVSVVQQQGDQEREVLCRSVPCRAATTVKLRLNERRYAEFNFPRGPYVADGVINILNGEQFGVEFEEKNGELSDPRYVKEIPHPERTVTLQLSFEENTTRLVITNPFKRTIRYDCLIQHYKQQGFNETSVLPVRAGLKSFESWPYPVTQLVISEVRYESQIPGSIDQAGGFSAGHIDPDNHRVMVRTKPAPKSAAADAGHADVTVKLRAMFRSDGTVTDITLLEARPKGFVSDEVIGTLTKHAMYAAKQIKFEPAQKGGQAVSQYMQLEYQFKLCGDQRNICE